MLVIGSCLNLEKNMFYVENIAFIKKIINILRKFTRNKIFSITDHKNGVITNTSRSENELKNLPLLGKVKLGKAKVNGVW